MKYVNDILIWRLTKTTLYTINIQLLSVSTSHSNASFNPVPFIAEILNSDQGRLFIDVRPSPLHIS